MESLEMRPLVDNPLIRQSQNSLELWPRTAQLMLSFWAIFALTSPRKKRTEHPLNIMQPRFPLASFLPVLALSGALCGCAAAQNASQLPAQMASAATIVPAANDAATPSGILAHSAQIWVGGSRAWPDYIAPGAASQWKFVADNADGFYINNFAMRLTDKTLKLAPDAQSRFEALRAMNGLLRHKNLFYETDQEHSTDEFEKVALDNFVKAGFEVKGVTINRGTNPQRSAILTADGQRPLYYMFGPWRGGGDIENAENADLRANIAKFNGAAVDGPVTMWRKNAGQMKPMVYSSIRWTQAHNERFLYLLAPNESGAGFLDEARRLAHDLEDNGANPDIWAVSFYGPPTFRDKLETLPEATPDGAPAVTFSGAAYWLIHHLRDSAGALKLKLDAQSARGFDFTLSNASQWLDLAPVVRARFDGEGELPAGLKLQWTIGERDVTEEINGEGLVFNRDLRLNPGEKRALKLRIVGDTKGAKVPVRLEVMPHPSTPIVQQTLKISMKPAR